MKKANLSFLLCLCVLVSSYALAQTTPEFTLNQYMVPMRDGVKLHTVILVPKGAQRAPMLLTRTPYAVEPYGVDVYPAEKSRMVRRFAPSVPQVSRIAAAFPRWNSP